MPTNLIPVKSFLGKYYPEILSCCSQDKYKNTNLEKFLEQRFSIQNNKTQMIVDPSVKGLVMVVSGNEIHISKELYDHPDVIISNSIENTDTQQTNYKSFYQPSIFQTVAYLICQNIVNLNIVGEIKEPIYVKYKGDFETFYSSVVTFELNDNVNAEIVEEVDSSSALNIVTDYVLNPFSKLKLSTFYQNNIAGMSFLYRNIFSRERTEFTHVVFGKGSSEIIDETKIRHASSAKSEFLGIINSAGRKFHTILSVEPSVNDYRMSVEYKNVLYGNTNVSFYPLIPGYHSTGDNSAINISNISVDPIPENQRAHEIKNYISPIVDRAILERTDGTHRFYENKTKFLGFL